MSDNNENNAEKEKEKQNQKVGLIVIGAVVGMIAGPYISHKLNSPSSPPAQQQVQQVQKKQIQKEFTTAEKNNIWREDLQKKLDKNYSVKTDNFYYVDNLKENYKYAKPCFDGVSANFKKFKSELEKVKNSDDIAEKVYAFDKENYATQKEFCKILQSDITYESCFDYSVNANMIAGGALLSDKKKVTDNIEQMESNAFKCAFALTLYDNTIKNRNGDFDKNKSFTIQSKNESPPFIFCELSSQNKNNYVCMVTDLMNAGIITKF